MVLLEPLLTVLWFGLCIKEMHRWWEVGSEGSEHQRGDEGVQRAGLPVHMEQLGQVLQDL